MTGGDNVTAPLPSPDPAVEQIELELTTVGKVPRHHKDPPRKSLKTAVG